MMRSELLAVVVVALLAVLVGCSSPAPTPTATPTRTPTPVPTPLPRAEATELAASIGWQLGSIETRAEFRAFADKLGGPTVDILCMISDGLFAPDLTLDDLTDNGTSHMQVKVHCIRMHST